MVSDTEEEVLVTDSELLELEDEVFVSDTELLVFVTD